MKPSWLWLRKRLFGSDLFSRTQADLTRRYSLLLCLFLLLFIAIVYGLLYVMIWNNQESKLQQLLDAEVKALQGPLYTDIVKGTFDKPGQRPFELSADQAFYYLLSPAGSVLTGAELQKELGRQALDWIQAGALQTQVLDKVELQTDEGAPIVQEAGETHSTKRKAVYLAGKRDVYRGGQFAGTLYAGKDVTFQEQLFAWLLAALLGIAALFLALVAVFGGWMSRQAMIPIRRAYERQQQFVADASHELRTPLSTLLASVETLDMERGAEEAWVVEGMKEEIQRMSRLAGDLLLLARSDAGEKLLHKTWFDGVDTAEQTVSRLRPLARNQQVDVSLEVPAELTVFQDRESIVQIIVILLENAIKYTLPGGKVKVTLTCQKGSSPSKLLIEVWDTGIGIAEEELPRIFERFYRPDKSRSRQFGGHGLGLAIAKEIVGALGGTIQAASKPGEGSSFKVELPALFQGEASG